MKDLGRELDTVAGGFLVPEGIGYGDVAAVRDRVAALDGFPGGVLFFVL